MLKIWMELVFVSLLALKSHRLNFFGMSYRTVMVEFASLSTLPRKSLFRTWTRVIQLTVPVVQGDTPWIKKKETQAVEGMWKLLLGQTTRRNSSPQSVRLYTPIRGGIQWGEYGGDDDDSVSFACGLTRHLSSLTRQKIKDVCAHAQNVRGGRTPICRVFITSAFAIVRTVIVDLNSWRANNVKLESNLVQQRASVP